MSNSFGPDSQSATVDTGCPQVRSKSLDIKLKVALA
jgi:hypothetical protein